MPRGVEMLRRSSSTCRPERDPERDDDEETNSAIAVASGSPIFASSTFLTSLTVERRLVSRFAQRRRSMCNPVARITSTPRRIPRRAVGDRAPQKSFAKAPAGLSEYTRASSPEHVAMRDRRAPAPRASRLRGSILGRPRTEPFGLAPPGRPTGIRVLLVRRMPHCRPSRIPIDLGLLHVVALTSR